MTSRPTIRSTLIGPFRQLAADDSGATAIEYALVASGVGAAVAATVFGLGTTLTTFYTSVSALF
jgi:pilus assembly protein Flp/PilA